MHKYRIEGGIPIRGTIAASGNKNAALPCIAATLLSEEPVILRNIPEIEDTGVMLLILQALGASVEKNRRTRMENRRFADSLVGYSCDAKQKNSRFNFVRRSLSRSHGKSRHASSWWRCHWAQAR